MSTVSISLDDAMKQLARISSNGRSWSEGLTFVRWRSRIMQAMDWDHHEFSRQLESAKEALDG